MSLLFSFIRKPSNFLSTNGTYGIAGKGYAMGFLMTTQPILALPVRAVVNRANTGLQITEGERRALFEAAGFLPLQRACRAVGFCRVGDAVATSGFGLSSEFIIHAVPPRWCGGKHEEDRLLFSSYRAALRCAVECGARTVAFPLLSEGCCGYPTDRGIQVAKRAILTFPEEVRMMVYLVLPSEASLRAA